MVTETGSNEKPVQTSFFGGVLQKVLRLQFSPDNYCKGRDGVILPLIVSLNFRPKTFFSLSQGEQLDSWAPLWANLGHYWALFEIVCFHLRKKLNPLLW